MTTASVFCAAIISRRYLSRKSDLARDVLLDPELLDTSRRHLGQVGLRLVESAYSDHLGVALLEKTEDGDNVIEGVFGADEPQPFITAGLQRDQLALAMLLWAILCLPKRQPEEPQDGNAAPNPKILISTLIADYPQLGHPRTIKSNLTRLKSLAIVDYGLDEYVVEGPLLEILFDGDGIAGCVTDQSFRDTLQKLRSATEHAGAQGDLLVGQASAPEEETSDDSELSKGESR